MSIMNDIEWPPICPVFETIMERDKEREDIVHVDSARPGEWEGLA